MLCATTLPLLSRIVLLAALGGMETDDQRRMPYSRAYLRIACFLTGLPNSAEQLVLSEALRHFLQGSSSPQHVGSTRPDLLLLVVCIGDNQAEPIEMSVMLVPGLKSCARPDRQTDG